MKTLMLLFILIFVDVFNVYAQKTNTDSIDNQQVVTNNGIKNVIKYNATSTILYNKTYVFSFERVLNEKQTIHIQAGYLTMPPIIANSSLLNQSTLMKHQNLNNGFTLGADYRFYLTNLNRKQTPSGVYIAPFFSYYQFNNNLDISIDPERNFVNSKDINIDANFNAMNLGFIMGYQFIIKKHFSLDMVLFGPSFSSYASNIKITKNEDNTNVKEALGDLGNKISDHFPNKMANTDQLTKEGRNRSWGGGYRYSINLGWAFN